MGSILSKIVFKNKTEIIENVPKNFFELKCKDIDFKEVDFSVYKNKKIIMLLNVACDCGLTDKNYPKLVDLYSKHNKNGLEILGFPSNQFFGQEKRSEADIKEFVTDLYNVNFPLFSKIEVNGPNTHDIFKYLRMNSELKVSENKAKQIPWNFAKFLVNHEGKVIKFYHPNVDHKTIENEIEQLLNN